MAEGFFHSMEQYNYKGDKEMSVGQTLHETLKYNGILDETQRNIKIRKTLESVLLSEELLLESLPIKYLLFSHHHLAFQHF